MLRIVPALAAMLFVTLILSYPTLFSLQFEALVSESLAASIFFSNYYYFTLADYFDTGAYEKLLLHTWSLGVEFQFYLTFPLLLLFSNIFESRKVRLYVLVSVACVSIDMACVPKWDRHSCVCCASGRRAICQPLAFDRSGEFSCRWCLSCIGRP